MSIAQLEHTHTRAPSRSNGDGCVVAVAGPAVLSRRALAWTWPSVARPRHRQSLSPCERELCVLVGPLETAKRRQNTQSATDVCGEFAAWFRRSEAGARIMDEPFLLPNTKKVCACRLCPMADARAASCGLHAAVCTGYRLCMCMFARCCGVAALLSGGGAPPTTRGVDGHCDFVGVSGFGLHVLVCVRARIGLAGSASSRS